MNDSTTPNPDQGPGEATRPLGPPLDEYTAAVMIAAFKAINSGYPFAALHRRNLFSAAYGVIRFLLQTEKGDQANLITEFAELNIYLTKFLDQIVLNGTEDDERLLLLRNMAEVESCWPTMVRPGDNEFSASNVEKLWVGINSVIRRLAKDAKKPASFATARNSLAFRLLRLLLNRACVISTTSDDEIAIQYIKMTMPEAREGERAAQLLPIWREINQLPAGNSPLTRQTVSRWNRWLTGFLLITDPELTGYPELQRVKSGRHPKFLKGPKAILRYQLGKFFTSALNYLAK